MPFGGLLTVGAISAGSSIFGGLFGASASQKAAQEYEQALQQGENYLEGQETQGIQNEQPYLTAGSQATNTLASLMGTPGEGLLTNWNQQFTAPTAAQAAQTPGYQFQLKAGEDAAQNSAAGQGSLLSGRTLADLNNYAQGVASTNYQNTFNNSLAQYQSAYNTFLNNQNNQYSRLMGQSQLGQQAAGSTNQFIQGMGGDIASLMGQKGAAAAAGTIGSANAYSNMFSSLGNTATQMYGLSQLNGGGSTDSLYADPSLYQTPNGYMPGGGPAPVAPYSPFNLPTGSTPSFPGFAMGTDFAPGGTAMVGEAGPELVNLPRGSQVVPNYQLSSLNGGGIPPAPIANPMRPISGFPGAPGMPMPVWGAQPPRSIASLMA